MTLDKYHEEPIEPLRSENEGFPNEKEAYLQSLGGFGQLPQEIEHLRHRIDWPVDMQNPHSHITTHFGAEQNYSDPEPSQSPHYAVDVQLDLGSKITAPENNLIVVMVSIERRGLADIILYSKESGIVYRFCHLEASSLPENLLKRTNFDINSEVKLNKGDEIGMVGRFFNEYTAEQGVAELDPTIIIPPSVEEVFGRSYNHIHISVHYYPNRHEFWQGLSLRNHINPLLLFKRLYQ